MFKTNRDLSKWRRVSRLENRSKVRQLKFGSVCESKKTGSTCWGLTFRRWYAIQPWMSKIEALCSPHPSVLMYENRVFYCWDFETKYTLSPSLLFYNVFESLIRNLIINSIWNSSIEFGDFCCWKHWHCFVNTIWWKADCVFFILRTNSFLIWEVFFLGGGGSK